MLTKLDLTMDETMTQGDADAITEVERKTWDRSAAIYAESAARLTRHALPVLIEACGLTRGSHAIDVGCGPGLVANMKAETGREYGFSYRFESSRDAGPHTRICLTTLTSRFDHVRVPLMGDHQAINCALALGMLDVLKNRGFAIDDRKAVDGLASVHLSGRMEILKKEPRILVDGAHNAASVDALMRAIGQNIPYDSMVIIFGCQKDKDIAGMLKYIQLGADKVIFTTTGSPRSADPMDLGARFSEMSSKMCQVADDLSEALSIATRAVSRDDLICITGSFYLVGTAKRLLSR